MRNAHGGGRGLLEGRFVIAQAIKGQWPAPAFASIALAVTTLMNDITIAQTLTSLHLKPNYGAVTHVQTNEQNEHVYADLCS